MSLASDLDILANILSDSKDAKFANLQRLRELALESHGFDILGIYDLHTGKRIGYSDESEVLWAIDELESNASDEEIIDDLMVRIVASMRPSIRFNKPDRLTLSHLVNTDPVGAFAYLANRICSNRKTLVARGESTFKPLFARIAMYNHAANLHESKVDLTPWIHWMLELDAKMNLHDVESPMFVRSILGRYQPAKTHDVAGAAPIFMLITDSNSAEILPAFERWVFARLDSYDARDRQLQKEASWFKGNAHAARAFGESWLNNPDIAKRKHDAKEKLKSSRDSADKPTKAGRPQGEKRKAAESKLADSLNLLESILTAAPAPQPVGVFASQPKPAQPAKPLGALAALGLNIVR